MTKLQSEKIEGKTFQFRQTVLYVNPRKTMTFASYKGTDVAAGDTKEEAMKQIRKFLRKYR